MSESEIKLSEPEDLSSAVPVSDVDVATTETGKTVASTVSATQSKQAEIAPGTLKNVRFSEEREIRVNVHDVAALILQHQGEMTAMKLQKLVYYSQVWSLVWDEQPLFDEQIEAWANGPVVRELYARHQGRFKVQEWNGDPQKLSTAQRETVEKVLEFYGGMSSQALSDLTHNEKPWQRARADLGPGDRGSRVISHASMFEYYSSL